MTRSVRNYTKEFKQEEAIHLALKSPSIDSTAGFSGIRVLIYDGKNISPGFRKGMMVSYRTEKIFKIQLIIDNLC